MLLFRWILGSILVLIAGGFAFLSIVGRGFRRSFGASEINPLITLLPFLGLALLFSALIFTGTKLLLHAAAVVAVAFIGICVWQMISDQATILWFAIFYLVAWLAFYWQTAFG